MRRSCKPQAAQCRRGKHQAQRTPIATPATGSHATTYETWEVGARSTRTTALALQRGTASSKGTKNKGAGDTKCFRHPFSLYRTYLLLPAHVNIFRKLA